MSMSGAVSSQGDTRTLTVQGRFDFKMHRMFREMYEGAPPEIGRYVIDLNKTVYMDSSALGMLLLLREHVGGEPQRVRIVNCNAEIRKILEVARFDMLFEIA
ncbi:MAG: STAS domain-containing protein [Gammaproteobacteria bacterium]|nr:STAS domain-containing protein [Gammaproteobacteria bacterium]